jgi:hypothetical protein
MRGRFMNYGAIRRLRFHGRRRFLTIAEEKKLLQQRRRLSKAAAKLAAATCSQDAVCGAWEYVSELKVYRRIFEVALERHAARIPRRSN